MRNEKCEIQHSCYIQTQHTVETMNFLKKVFGQLVMLGFDIAVFTPASYQRHLLIKNILSR